MIRWILLLSLPASLISKTGFSQDLPDSLSKKNTNEIILHYNAAMKENLYIYNGAAYTGSYRKGNGHAYFLTDQAITGTVDFEGIRYVGIAMQYDLILGELVVNDYSKNFSLKPDPSKISSFTLDHHRFVHLAGNTSGSGFPGDGYYEELFSGRRSSVYARFKKQAVEPSRPDEPLKYFEYVNYYILKDGSFSEISSQNAMIKAYRDKEKQVRDFIQSANLNYKKNNSVTLIKLAEFYEQLN
ncbi:MAG: hypothetical protein H7Y27_16120 [Gemmatimonadaceae bacterium]|nr:hypothetical protein [Chitinophagaceae bacterium]